MPKISDEAAIKQIETALRGAFDDKAAKRCVERILGKGRLIQSQVNASNGGWVKITLPSGKQERITVRRSKAANTNK